MTQFSWPWGCDQVGDGGAASYTLDVVETTNRIRTNLDPTANGVIYWTDTTVLPFTSFVNASDGLLEPTNPSGNTVRIASGIGLVQGWLYANDDNVDFDASGAASATDLIVMRRDRSAQTVRLALVQAAASGTAVVTQNSTTWEIALTSIELDGSGNVSRINDLRTLVKPPVGSWTLIETLNGTAASGTISFTSIPPLHTHLKVIAYTRCDGGAVGQNIELTFNGDTAANYDSSVLQASNSTVTQTLNVAANAINLGFVTGAGGAAGRDSLEILVTDYTAAQPKNVISNSNAKRDGTNGATGLTTNRTDGWWSGTAIISQIDLILSPGANWLTTTTFSLYGIV